MVRLLVYWIRLKPIWPIKTEVSSRLSDIICYPSVCNQTVQPKDNIRTEVLLTFRNYWYASNKQYVLYLYRLKPTSGLMRSFHIRIFHICVIDEYRLKPL